MGERYNIRWILFGLLALVAVSAGTYWWWAQNAGGGVNMADAGNLRPGIAAGPHVAHVYADSASLSLSESWMLDGNTCRTTVVVGRQLDAAAPALDLPAPAAFYPFEILSRGAFSLVVPDGVRVDAVGALYTSRRIADWTDPANLDDALDLEIARYPYQTGRMGPGGRTVVSTVGLVATALPWADAMRGQRRVAVLEIAASPMSRCDALTPRWEASYGLDVQSTAVRTPAPTPTPDPRRCPNYSWYDPHGHRCVPNPTLAPGEEVLGTIVNDQTPQTLFMGGSSSSTFTAADFTVRLSGISPVSLTLAAGVGGSPCVTPYEARSCRHVGLAVPADLTITSVVRVGLADQEWCGSIIPDCAITNEITIEEDPYQYLQAGPYFAISEVDLLIRWTE